MKRSLSFAFAAVSTCAFIITCVAPVQHATAQSAPTGQALEIAPPVVSVTADPGQTIKTNIKLRDISKGSLIVNGQVDDFAANGEDGTPKIILDNSTPNPYSLKDWIDPLASFTIKSKELKDLPVTIHVPESASPGSYFGVIRFTATPPELEGTGVSLSASIGSLIFLRVNGVAKESLAVQELSANINGGSAASLFESAPINFTVKLKNTGNVYEQPAGRIVVTDMFGKEVGAPNLAPGNILPQSTRKYNQALDSTVIGNKFLFGRYRADLSVTYGANKSVVKQTIYFWVIPYKLIGLGIIILIGGFIGLRFLIRRYNNHIIKKSSQR